MSPWSHRAGCGDASIGVLSLWSENSAKLALFCVHGYPFGFAKIRQNSYVFVRRAHAQIATAWSRFRHRDDIKRLFAMMNPFVSERILWISLHTACKHFTSGVMWIIWCFLELLSWVSWSCELYLTYLSASLISAIRARIPSENERVRVDFTDVTLVNKDGHWTVSGGTQCHPESGQTIFRNFLNIKKSPPPSHVFGKLMKASASVYSSSLKDDSRLQFSGSSCIGTPSGSPGSVSVSPSVSVTSSSSKEGSSWSD
jgi:hypothetical protein